MSVNIVWFCELQNPMPGNGRLWTKSKFEEELDWTSERRFSHMKVRELMTPNPVCCLPTDTAQKVAAVLRDNDIGSVPVLENQHSRKLIGVITDRDLCCSVMADGLDPKNTPIEKFISLDPVSCHDGENVEKCEKAMQEHQVR